jgi:hypothetical protein
MRQYIINSLLLLFVFFIFGVVYNNTVYCKTYIENKRSIYITVCYENPILSKSEKISKACFEEQHEASRTILECVTTTAIQTIENKVVNFFINQHFPDWYWQIFFGIIACFVIPFVIINRERMFYSMDTEHRTQTALLHLLSTRFNENRGPKINVITDEE